MPKSRKRIRRQLHSRRKPRTGPTILQRRQKKRQEQPREKRTSLRYRFVQLFDLPIVSSEIVTKGSERLTRSRAEQGGGANKTLKEAYKAMVSKVRFA
jgi:hypothetical protein